MPARDETKLADRISDARKDAHLTQADLGRLVGVSRAAISQFEQGRAKPSLGTLRQIAEATKRPIAWFWIEDAAVAMRSVSSGTPDSTIEMLNSLPPIVRLALERRLQKAAEYASSLPEWIKTSGLPSNQDDLNAAIESINRDLDSR
jgi:transcriptional regulator with XRE-family HTH domain